LGHERRQGNISETPEPAAAAECAGPAADEEQSGATDRSGRFG
jgi:hypothetical protein